MSDVDTVVVLALYPGRRRDRIYEFVEEFAGAGALAVALGGRKVTLVDEQGAATRTVAARTVREAVELGLINPDWALRIDVPSDGTGMSVIVAYTADRHSVLGLSAPVGDMGDDEVHASMERSMRRMMNSFPAEVSIMGDDLAVEWTAQQYAATLRRLNSDPEHTLPWFARGEWFTKVPVRIDAGAGDDVLSALEDVFRSRGVPVSVKGTYPVQRLPGGPWSVLVEAPFDQFRKRLERTGDGGEGTAMATLIEAIADARTDAGPVDVADDQDAFLQRLLVKSGTTSQASGRVIFHDIVSDCQWVAEPGLGREAFDQIDTSDVQRGAVYRYDANAGVWSVA